MKTDNKFYYFAYGSNLSKKQTQARCKGAVPLGQASLTDYQLCFDGYGSRWGGGAATIVKKLKATTMGVLYVFSKENVTQMDSFETIYQKIKVSIETYPNLDVYTYLKPLSYSLPPSIAYLTRVMQGYLDFNLDFSLLEIALKKSNFIGKALFTPTNLEQSFPKPEAKLLIAKSQPIFKNKINGGVFFYANNLKSVLAQLEQKSKILYFSEKNRVLKFFKLKNGEYIPAWYSKLLID